MKIISVEPVDGGGIVEVEYWSFWRGPVREKYFTKVGVNYYDKNGRRQGMDHEINIERAFGRQVDYRTMTMKKKRINNDAALAIRYLND